jgi:hypothetical protein
VFLRLIRVPNREDIHSPEARTLYNREVGPANHAGVLTHLSPASFQAMLEWTRS